MPPPDEKQEGNGRLQSALTAADVKRLHDDVRQLEADVSTVRERLNEIRLTQARQGERQTLWQAFQTGLTLIIGALAAYLGRLP